VATVSSVHVSHGLRAATAKGTGVGAFGAGLGAIVGATTQTESWQDVTPFRARTALLPARGIVLGLALAF
jgi:hypothetical protein